MKIMIIPKLEGPYRPSRRAVILSFLAHAMALCAIGTLSAVTFLGMSGWL